MNIQTQIKESVSYKVFGSWAARMLIGGIDFDDVMFNYRERYIQLCRDGGYGDISGYFEEWGLLETLPPEIIAYVNSIPNFYIPEFVRWGEVATLKKMKESAIEPYIITSSFRKQAASKLELIDKYIGEEYASKTIIVRKKSMILLDFLVDDCQSNIQQFNLSKMGISFLYATPRTREGVPPELASQRVSSLEQVLEQIRPLQRIIQ